MPCLIWSVGRSAVRRGRLRNHYICIVTTSGIGEREDQSMKEEVAFSGGLFVLSPSNLEEGVLGERVGR